MSSPFEEAETQIDAAVGRFVRAFGSLEQLISSLVIRLTLPPKTWQQEEVHAVGLLAYNLDVSPLCNILDKLADHRFQSPRRETARKIAKSGRDLAIYRNSVVHSPPIVLQKVGGTEPEGYAQIISRRRAHPGDMSRDFDIELLKRRTGEVFETVHATVILLAELNRENGPLPAPSPPPAAD